MCTFVVSNYVDAAAAFSLVTTALVLFAVSSWAATSPTAKIVAPAIISRCIAAFVAAVEELATESHELHKSVEMQMNLVIIFMFLFYLYKLLFYSKNRGVLSTIRGYILHCLTKRARKKWTASFMPSRLTSTRHTSINLQGLCVGILHSLAIVE